MPLPDYITSNPLVRETHARHRRELLSIFDELKDCPNQHFLSLHKYVRQTPYKFFSDESYRCYYDWLIARGKQAHFDLVQYVTEHEAELNQALIHLEEVNAYDWHDHFDRRDDYEEIRFIDQKVHPTYLRLIEAVFTPFLRIIAHFSRIDRGRNTVGLDTYNIVEELNQSGLDTLTGPYVHLIRNGIGHGHITYLLREIQYADKKGNSQTFDTRRIIILIDELLDTCNGMALALTMFQIMNQARGLKILNQFLIDELRHETMNPWWQVTGCVSAEIPGKSQLVVYVRSKATLKEEIQYYAFQTGILAEYFARGYDRYFISFYTQKKQIGWLSLHGDKLSQLRVASNTKVDDYGAAIDNIYVHSRFRLLGIIRKIITLKRSFRVNWRYGFDDARKELGWPSISVRNADIHRNKWGVVLNGAVVVERPEEKLARDIVRGARRRIVHKALRQARKRTSRLNIARYLPLDYCHLSLFQRDYRRRKLANYGLGKDLIGTIRVRRIKRIQVPDIIGSTIEVIGGYRIAWNAAWLTEMNQ